MFAETCVFDKQSKEPIYCGPQQREPPGAPLIANLRGHFAEFLNHRSPERLSLLDPPTCVSFSTVSMIKTRSFSWTTFQRNPGQASWSNTLNYESILALSISVNSTDISVRPHALRLPSLHRSHTGTGILTCYPSSTPFGLD